MRPRILYRAGGRSVGDVAELWGVPVGRVRGWLARGLLTPDGENGAATFSEAALGAFLREHGHLLDP